jgi:hypothetical protein
MTRSLACLAVLALLCTACGSSTDQNRTSRPAWVRTGAYAPSIRPADFVPAVTNPYFPLEPGTKFRYFGHKGSKSQFDIVLVTRATKRIFGVPATVVRDTVFQRRRPVERTSKWYAQDIHGNVWFMGEKALARRRGRWVGVGGSWTAGVRGAEPGIVMRGHPHLGDHYRLESFRRGGALDQARVIALDPLTTLQWSPVAPQLVKKVYVAGVGEVSERGGNEAFKLVAVMRG